MKRNIIAGTIFFAAALLVFGRSCFFTETVFDDVIYIGRRHLLDFSLENIAFWWAPVLNLWSPLAGYSFMLDRLIWGETLLFGAHLINILLHVLAAAGVFLTAKTLKISEKTAFFLTLFWMLHPQRPESVVWISERKDVLVLALGAWCMYLFCRQAEKNRISFAAAALFLLSFGVKPTLVVMPLILMLLTVRLLERWDWRRMLRLSGVFWAVSLIYMTVFLFRGGAGGALRLDIPRMAWQLGNYFWKNFYWLDLNPVYPDYSPVNASLLPFLLGGGVFLVLICFCRKKDPCALYSLLPFGLCFAAAAAPHLFRIGHTDLADRYSYFPSVFIVFALGVLYELLENRFPRRKMFFRTAVFAVILCAAGLSFFRVSIWESSDTCVAAALEHPRPNYRMLMASAAADFRNGDYAQTLQKADRLKSEYQDLTPSSYKDIVIFAHACECGVLFRTGRLQEGCRHLTQLFSDPEWDRIQYASYQFSRDILLPGAEAFLRCGDPAQAADCYRRLGKIYGAFEPMERFFYQGVAALVQGNKTEALRCFEQAHRLNPADENVRKNLEMLKRPAGAAVR